MEKEIKWQYAIFLAIFTFTLGFLAASSPKCINEVETSDLVIIEDIHYRASYVIPMVVGKIITTRVVPAEYKVYISYKDCEYSISGSETYNLYKDKVGQKVAATIITHEYDNGTTRTEVKLPTCE